MIKLKLFHGGVVLVRASMIASVAERGEGGVDINISGRLYHVSHTTDQVMSAMSKVRPIDADDSLFGRVFGAAGR